MDVPHEYVPMRKIPDDFRGYSEAKLKARLERQGWMVWRGELIALTRAITHGHRPHARKLLRRLATEPENSPAPIGAFSQDREGRAYERAAPTAEIAREVESVLDYPNVRRKYERLLLLLQRDHAAHLELLQYFCAVHHGIPDFLCYRGMDGCKEWKFVECKLIYEQLSDRQKTCIAKLQALGFAVEVHKLIDHRTKLRRAGVDLATGRKRVKEKQLKLPRRTKKRVLERASAS